MTSDTIAGHTGAAFDLANAGYTPMPDQAEQHKDEPIGSDSASLRAAAGRRVRPQEDVVIRRYRDDEGKPVAATAAITLERASRDYADAVASDKVAVEKNASMELADRIDELRTEAQAADPDAAEFYGFELPENSQVKTDSADKSLTGETDNPAHTNDEDPMTKLDPEVEKALRHPQVVHAIEQQVAEADKARQEYVSGLAAATQIAQASFLSQFPELINVKPENMPGALEQLSRQDPEKFERVRSMIATTEHLFAQQQQQGRYQAELAQQGFHNYAKSEDTRLEAMLKDEPPEIQRAVAAEIVASAKASGVEEAEFVRLFRSEPLMRNAAFQHMMYDAAKYRLMMKAKDVAASRPLPPVQRPGMARTPSEREHADLHALNARLSSSGDIKDAVALYHARKSHRR